MPKKKGKKGKGKNDWDDDDFEDGPKKPVSKSKKKSGGGFGGGFDDFDDDGFDDGFDDAPKKKASSKKKNGGDGFDDGFDDDAPKKKGGRMSKAQRKQQKQREAEKAARKKAQAEKAARAAAGEFDDEDGFDDEPEEAATAQDNAFAKFQAAQKAGKSKKQKKKDKKTQKKVTNAFAAFDDGEEVDSDSIGSDDSSLNSAGEEPKPKKKLSKKEKRMQAQKRKQEALAAMMAEEDGFDDEDDDEPAAEKPAEAAPEPEPEPEEPAVEAATAGDIWGDDAPKKKKQPKKDKPLTKAQKKKAAKKLAYEKKKAQQAVKKAAAAKRAAEEDAALEAQLAALDADEAKPKPKKQPQPAGQTKADTDQKDDAPQDEPQVTAKQLKARKKREKKAEQARKNREVEEQKKIDRKKKKEKDYFTRAEKAYKEGDYENVTSYLDMLDRGKPEFFADQSKELRAKIVQEQADYEKAEKLLPEKLLFAKVFKDVEEEVPKFLEALGLLEPIKDTPIVTGDQVEDQNDGGKAKTLYDIVKFKCEWIERQQDAAQKKREKRDRQKANKKNKSKAKGGANKRNPTMVAQLRKNGMDDEQIDAYFANRGKKGGKGKQNKRKKAGKKGRVVKTQAQIDAEHRAEFEVQAAAEAIRKEKEAIRIAAEKAEEIRIEEQRQARIKAEEEARRQKIAAMKAEQNDEDDPDDDGDDWNDSDDEDDSPKKPKAEAEDADEGDEDGWEDSADSDDNRYDEDEEDEARGGNGYDQQAGGEFVDDFEDEKEGSGDEKKWARGARSPSTKRLSGFSPSAAEGLAGQAGVDARRRAKEAELAQKRDSKFRSEVNKSLKRNQKDWTKMIRKLPERKAYRKFQSDGDYEEHSRKTLLRDMIADSIQQDDPNGWASYILPEAQVLLEGKVKATIEAFSDKRVKSNLRAPIGVIMGHVDTGKTKILDYIRKTKIQDNEVGGITQQIGASFLPIDLIKEKAVMVQKHVSKKLNYDLPGLLIIDTPGHESFSNLRARGSSLCDIAVLVIDIMHSLEPQTIESINMLKKAGHTFVIALNKIDRLYDWKINKDWDFQSTFAEQPAHTQQEFKTRLDQSIADLAAKVEVNADLWYKVDGKHYTDTTLICPTSAHTGEGLSDLLMLLVQLSQRTLGDRLQLTRELTATILEVKTTVGHGYTLDVVLQNGFINRGDTILVCGMEGVIKTQIRALLVPAEAKEMRAKGEWHHMDQIQAAAGVRVSAPGLQKAIAGTELRVIPLGCGDDEIEEMMDEVQAQYSNVLGSVDKSGDGVFVIASTLGALEALITFLHDEQKVPISGVSIGQVYKKQVMQAAVMVDKKPEYAVILAFNVRIEAEVRDLAEDSGVRIFEAEIIYNLFDDFKAYMAEFLENKRADAKDDVVFPVKLQIFEDKVFRARDPLIMGVKVVAGTLRKGTPLVAMKFEKTRKGNIAAPFPIGVVGSIENEGKDMDIADVGDEVAIKVLADGLSVMPMYQRHFDYNHTLYSRITRGSIDALKENYREEAIKHLTLLKLMKQFFNII